MHLPVSSFISIVHASIHTVNFKEPYQPQSPHIFTYYIELIDVVREAYKLAQCKFLSQTQFAFNAIQWSLVSFFSLFQPDCPPTITTLCLVVCRRQSHILPNFFKELFTFISGFNVHTSCWLAIATINLCFTLLIHWNFQSS